MGSGMSLIQKAGLPSPRTITNQIYSSLPKDITEFDQFHTAILEVFTKMNSILPGVHYNVPPYKDVKGCYDKWVKATDEKDKKASLELLLQKSHPSKTDNSLVVTGLVAPPAAMMVKRTGENIPPFNVIKIIPDVLFVPTATLLALISVKFYNLKNTTINVDETALNTTSKGNPASSSAGVSNNNPSADDLKKESSTSTSSDSQPSGDDSKKESSTSTSSDSRPSGDDSKKESSTSTSSDSQQSADDSKKESSTSTSSHEPRAKGPNEL